MVSNKLKNIVFAGLVLFSIGQSSIALAGTILADDGIVRIEKNPSLLGITAVTDPGGDPVGMIPFEDGQILMEDYAGNALNTYSHTVSGNPSWWNAPGIAYTTTTHGIILEFVDLDVTSFTFNIGANMAGSAWIRAYYDDGVGNHLTTNWFGGINQYTSPSYGVVVNDPQTSCAVITKVEIDPSFVWGVGNFGVAQNNCQSVPEPESNLMLGMGLLILFSGVYTRRRTTVLA